MRAPRLSAAIRRLVKLIESGAQEDRRSDLYTGILADELRDLLRGL